jgi:serine/threonine protein kinase
VTIACPKCETNNPEDSKFCKECATPLHRIGEAVHTKTIDIETPAEKLATGSTFAGRYQIIEELGRGGMGKVYKVYDKEIKEKVALKLIKPEIASDEKTIERFRNEIRLARRIVHKNVGRMYDLSKEKSAYYITMEFVSGEDLKGLTRRVSLDIGTIISIFKQVCEGLSEAHKSGVIHRDLKPSNIMIDREGSVRIMDFGIARSLQAKGITGTGIMIGTPEYMSPEQVEGKEIDQRTDIYSLGVILYEIVTGQLPFDGETPFSIAMKHKSEAFTPPQLLNPGIPDGLNDLILKCLEKDKKKRYQTAEQVAEAIGEIEKKIPLPKKIIPTKKPLTSKEITVKLNVKKALIPVFIFLVFIAIAVYLLLRQRGTDSGFIPGTTKQISYEPGLELDPSISPDGKLVAFATGPLGKTKIVVRQIAGGHTLEINRDFSGNQRWPQWSPDQTKLAFYSDGAIYEVPALGGIPKKLVDRLGSSSAYSPAWSPDGEKIAYVQNESIHILNLETGESEKIVDAEEAHCLSWSPDGSKMAFVSGNISFVFSSYDISEAFYPIIGNIAPCSVNIVTLSDKKPVQVTDNENLNVSPSWTPDGKRLLFITNRGGARDIYAISIATNGEPKGSAARVTTGLDAHSMNISKDEMKLAYSGFNYTANIWSIEIPDRGSVSVSDAQPITTGNQIIETMDISHDGQWLVFDSNLSGNMDVYKVPVAGGDSVQLTTHPSDDFVPQWSPDTEQIAFHSFRNGNRDVFCMTNEGRSLQPITDDPSHERAPDWSPDAKKNVFFSDKTGRNEVYVVSKIDTGWGETQQLTHDGGRFPKWSPVGDSIVYISGAELKIIGYGDKKIRNLVNSQDDINFAKPEYPAWSLDGETVYYIAMDNQADVSIWAVSTEGGEPEQKVIFDDPYKPIGLFNLSTDSQRFYFTIRLNESNIWVMDLISQK